MFHTLMQYYIYITHAFSVIQHSPTQSPTVTSTPQQPIENNTGEFEG